MTRKLYTCSCPKRQTFGHLESLQRSVSCLEGTFLAPVGESNCVLTRCGGKIARVGLVMRAEAGQIGDSSISTKASGSGSGVLGFGLLAGGREVCWSMNDIRSCYELVTMLSCKSYMYHKFALRQVCTRTASCPYNPATKANFIINSHLVPKHKSFPHEHHQSSGYSSLILLTNLPNCTSHLLKYLPASPINDSPGTSPPVCATIFSSATYRTLLSSAL